MIQTFFIPGVLPGLNEVIDARAKRLKSGRGNLYTLMKRKECESIEWLIKQDKLEPMGRVKVSFTWYEASKRRDPDNVRVGAKFILDALVKAKVLATDGWAGIAGLTDTFIYRPETPGVEVTLESEAP